MPRGCTICGRGGTSQEATASRGQQIGEARSCSGGQPQKQPQISCHPSQNIPAQIGAGFLNLFRTEQNVFRTELDGHMFFLYSHKFQNRMIALILFQNRNGNPSVFSHKFQNKTECVQNRTE
jgi:hypothetical protein